MRLGSQVWLRAWAALPSMQQWQHLCEERDSRLGTGELDKRPLGLHKNPRDTPDTPLVHVPRTARKHPIWAIYLNVRSTLKSILGPSEPLRSVGKELRESGRLGGLHLPTPPLLQDYPLGHPFPD